MQILKPNLLGHVCEQEEVVGGGVLLSFRGAKGARRNHYFLRGDSFGQRASKLANLNF